jgi:cytidylate kinase
MASRQVDHAIIVTIDGPAGSGKSSVARQVARCLGMQFLDTGAMYRAVAAAALTRGVDPADHAATARMAATLQIRFDWQTDPPRVLLDGKDVTDRIREADVTTAVSDVAANDAVRHQLVQAQRRIGREHPNLVTEGRDQGSVVFPHAAVKFYLDAGPEERARRRADQLRQMGKPADEKEILRQQIERDRRDQSRRNGPLVCPEDAVRIDTTSLTMEQVISRLCEQVRQAAGIDRGNPPNKADAS